MMERSQWEASVPDPIDEHRPQPARRSRRRRWIALGCMLALGLCFGRFAYLRITLRPTPRPAYWEAKLAALDPPPPGAISTDKALLLIAPLPWENDPAIKALTPFYPQHLLMGPWKVPRADASAVSQAFASHAYDNARREILRALEAGWAEPISLDPTAPGSSGSAHIKLSTWLLVHSRWAREETYDPATAAEDWLAALRAARQVRRGQTGMHVGAETRIIINTATEMMLAAREGIVLPDTRDLQIRADRIVGPPRDPREFLEGQRLAALCELEYVFVREGGQWMDVSEMMRVRYLAAVGTPLHPWRLWNLTSPLFHDLPEATRRAERFWAEGAKCVDLAACERIRSELNADPRTAIAPLDGWFGWCYPCRGEYDGNAMPAIRLMGHYEALCFLDGAFAMLALAAYRNHYGHYPETIAELIPRYLSREPIDCADRRPLHYRRAGNDYVLYSISVNGEDNDGYCNLSASYLKPYWFYGPSDAVFSTITREPAPWYSAAGPAGRIGPPTRPLEP
jgi:hypothetical protein